VRELLPGWAWTTLGEIADLKGGLTKGKKRRDGDRLRSVPYLRVENVQRGYLNLDEVKLIEATESEIEDLRLRVGDVLLILVFPCFALPQFATPGSTCPNARSALGMLGKRSRSS